MKNKIILHLFFVLSATILLAQNNKTVTEQHVKKNTYSNNSAGLLNTTAASGDSISFRDGDSNTLIKITDEGTVGSITISSAGSAPSTTTNKLYNVGSTLFFNGSSLGSGGGATSINGLSDAISDGSSVFLGNGSGVSDDGSNSNVAVGINALHSNTSGQYNTANGYYSLYLNKTGNGNIANGFTALQSNTSGSYNIANGYSALGSNTSGSENTAVGYNADVGSGNLKNATAIGYNAKVTANNTIQLGNDSVTTINAPVDLTITSDSTKKENFLKVDGEKVLEKFRKFKLSSWNYKNGNPKSQRHYGIMAQDFFSAFGHDAMGTVGNDTTINGADVNGINMIAIQALEKRTTEQDQRLNTQDKSIKTLEKRIEELEETNKGLRTQNTEIQKQNEEIIMHNAEINSQNDKIKNEFNNIKLFVNKLIEEQKKVNVIYK